MTPQVCVFYLVSEIVSAQYFFESGWKIVVMAIVMCMFTAWLVANWWSYIIGLEVVLAVVLLRLAPASSLQPGGQRCEAKIGEFRAMKHHKAL